MVGAENGKFGQWVAQGRSFSRLKEDAFDEASVEEGLESLYKLAKEAVDDIENKGEKVVCIVQECAEMPAYSNGLRKRLKVPVYDTMTAIGYVQMGTGFTSYASYMT